MEVATHTELSFPRAGEPEAGNFPVRRLQLEVPGVQDHLRVCVGPERRRWLGEGGRRASGSERLDVADKNTVQ